MYIRNIAINIANLSNICYNVPMENIFENKTQCNDILFRYAKGKSILEGNEIHPYHELLYFIKGEGKFYSDDFDTELCENILFVIPKNTYHRFSLTNQNSYTRLVLNFPELDLTKEIKILSDKKVSVFSTKNNDIEFLLKKICNAMSSCTVDEKDENLLYGGFLMLLSEISHEEYSKSTGISAEKHELISKCITHIEDNLSKKLTIENTAKKFNVSPSSLSQLFKKHLGISFYKYVTEKRISYAHTLISKGALPTKIYTECGFNDYATFYKAYVKMSGNPPSKK